MWQHSPRYTIVVYMQIVVPRSPVESFKLWLEQFSFMKEGCDIFFEPLEKVVRVSANYAYSSQKKKYARSMHSIRISRFLTWSKLE